MPKRSHKGGQMVTEVEIIGTVNESSQTDDASVQQHSKTYFHRWVHCILLIFIGCCFNILTLEYMIK
jgi:hypothetical protein